MPNKNKLHIPLALLALIATSLACGLPESNQDEVDAAVEATVAARELDSTDEDTAPDTAD